jgi:glutamyl-tRNA synthetase
MAPSPTGFLHIGGVHTFLFNWLFARGRGGECLLRIENTDTSREVAESVEQIQRSLLWMGLDWDGPLTFQLDAMERCRDLGRQLVSEGKAYEEEGAIRFRMPDEGVTGWVDAIRGVIEVPNEKIEDVVIVRSDGRATYNFASPVEDMDDRITHVIRGDDHISNTPKQINILRALGHEPPVYAHVGSIFGPDGKKLSKRHGAVSCGRLSPGGAHELSRPDRVGSRRGDDDHGAQRDRGAFHAGGRQREPGDVRLRQARLDERRVPSCSSSARVRGPARGVRR